MPHSSLRFGCPHHGKCECDACGGRMKKMLNTWRQAPDLLPEGFDPPRDAVTASLLWNEHGIRKQGGKFSHSELTPLGQLEVDAVRSARATSLGVPIDAVDAALKGRYKGSKMAREALFSEEQDCIGFRRLWCVCDACTDRDWSACWLHEYTGGEPRWLGSKEATVPDVASSSLVEETEAAAAARVRVGDIVARTHTDPDCPEFLYYLVRVTELAHVLAHDRTDDFGKEYKKDAVVIAGHFVEPDSGEFGPGPHRVWVEKTMSCLIFADSTASPASPRSC